MKNINNNILVVGLDGATWKVIKPLIKKGKLPNTQKFINNSVSGISQSTIPPLTPSVWTSFLTGVNPGKHGIFGFINYRKENNPLFTNKDINYWTIDEYLKEKKKKSYISYKNLDGLIKEAGTETHTISVKELIEKATLRVDKYKKQFNKKQIFSFILFKEIDIAQHLYWNKKELEEFFVLFDQIFADLITFYIKKYKDSANIIVLSDHGFHSAAKKQFSIYPWLVRENYLESNSNKSWKLVHGLNKSIKSIGIDLTKINFISNVRNKFVSKAQGSTDRKIKQLNKLVATFEGLYVFDTNINKYQLIRQLRSLKSNGVKVFQKVVLSEKVYKGSLYDKGPDIVWIPNEKFHINISSLETEIFSTRPTDIPGDHVADINGIYIVSSKAIEKITLPNKMFIYDLTAIVYDLLNIKKPLGLDGFSPLTTYKDLDKKINIVKKVIKKAFVKYGNNWAIAYTGRKDSTVMLNIIQNVCKENKYKLPKIMFIDHGEHFSESINFLKSEIKRMNLSVVWVETDKLHKSLAEKKIETMDKTIGQNKWLALMTAIRKDEHKARESEKYFSKRKTHTRIHPLLDFTEEDIWNYIKRYKIPYNLLYDKGYRSLEEKNQTAKVISFKQKERSGRQGDKEMTMQKLRNLGYF